MTTAAREFIVTNRLMLACKRSILVIISHHWCCVWWLCAGAFSIYWALAGRPELGGDLAARWSYLQDTFNSNRVGDRLPEESLSSMTFTLACILCLRLASLFAQ